MQRVQPPTALRLPCKACCWIPTPIPMALVAGRCRVWLSEFGRPPRIGALGSVVSALSRRCPDVGGTTYSASLPFEHHRPTLSG